MYNKKALRNFKMQFSSNHFEKRKGGSDYTALTASSLGRNDLVLNRIRNFMR